MAQFMDDVCSKVRFKVMDYVDVDSEKWRQIATGSKWPMRWIYEREATRLRAYENKIADAFDRLVFVSEKESAAFLTNNLKPAGGFEPSELHQNSLKAKMEVVSNGVDADFFDPDANEVVRAQASDRVYPDSRKIIVFTGVMNYRPNEDAVNWFINECLGEIRKACPGVMFYIVGARPSRCVLRLAKVHPDVRVTGSVTDIRPYMAQAQVVVAPLRIGRGIQNKVLEALAMDKPVVASQNALAGIGVDKQLAGITASDAAGFARKVIAVLEMSTAGETLKSEAVFGFSGRKYVMDHFSWKDRFLQMERMFKRNSGK
jgi:sugar transferase (PEP-CTERM/EpsH1 system associated)